MQLETAARSQRVIELSDTYELLCEVQSESETAHLSMQLAKSAQPGDVLVLTGELGTGKTTLVKYLAQALGIDPAAVRSPTFTLVHEYRQGNLPLIHMDVYRLGGPDDFEGIGGYEYLDTNRGLVVIEWGELILDALDEDWLQLRLEPGGTDPHTARTFWARSAGVRGGAWLERLRSQVRSSRT